MKAIANRVPVAPSDCNRGMYVWPWAPSPMSGIAKDGWPGARGVWKSQWAHVPGPQKFLRCVGETHVKCQLVHKAEP